MSAATVGRTWNSGVMSSLRSDWATPWKIVRMLSDEFQFTLDACATQETRICPAWFGPDTWDGLRFQWDTYKPGAVWCNPPYGREVGKWVEKAYRESRFVTVVMLLAARTDTSWFHDYCLKGEIRFLRGRLCFDDQHLCRAPFPSMIVIFRPEHKV